MQFGCLFLFPCQARVCLGARLDFIREFFPAFGRFVGFDGLCGYGNACYGFRKSVPFAFGSGRRCEGFHNDLFYAGIVESGKVDAGDAGGNGQCMYLLVAGYQALPQDAYALRNFKAGKVGAAYKAVLFDYGIRMVA